MDARELCEAFNAAVQKPPADPPIAADDESVIAEPGKSSVIPSAGNSPNVTMDYQKLAYQAQAAGEHLAAMQYLRMHNELSKP
ncbi:hypothetical protein [Mycolicibacterium mageritense]|uniref:Uncharacterized protein n=1 Tax=Mycolicibacterium mageritense TaxID=53462 RepID=A0AAI8XSD5_MYCME|nr:hypothetical protein [Mycolicibacterium mageritense]BDY32995.1 hypothetical protein hbim_06967 [Mycolicibacterium mageritense]